MSGFSKQSDRDGIRHERLYGGKGEVGTRHFSFGGAPFPAHFVVYDIPPGAGEGTLPAVACTQGIVQLLPSSEKQGSIAGTLLVWHCQCGTLPVLLAQR